MLLYSFPYIQGYLFFSYYPYILGYLYYFFYYYRGYCNIFFPIYWGIYFFFLSLYVGISFFFYSPTYWDAYFIHYSCILGCFIFIHSLLIRIFIITWFIYDFFIFLLIFFDFFQWSCNLKKLYQIYADIRRKCVVIQIDIQNYLFHCRWMILTDKRYYWRQLAPVYDICSRIF